VRRPEPNRLAAALDELGARIRAKGEPHDVDVQRSDRFLASSPLQCNLTTDAWDVDLTL